MCNRFKAASVFGIEFLKSAKPDNSKSYVKTFLDEYVLDCFKFGGKQTKSDYFFGNILRYIKYLLAGILHFFMDWNYLKTSLTSAFLLIKNNKMLLFFFFLLDVVIFIFIVKLANMKKRRRSKKEDPFFKIKHRHSLTNLFDEENSAKYKIFDLANDSSTQLNEQANTNDDEILDNFLHCINDMNRINMDASTFDRVLKKLNPILAKFLSLSVYHRLIEHRLIKYFENLSNAPLRRAQSLEPESFFKAASGSNGPRCSNEKCFTQDNRGKRSFDFLNLKNSLQNLEKLNTNFHLSPLIKEKIPNLEFQQQSGNADRTINHSRSEPNLDFSSD